MNRLEDRRVPGATLLERCHTSRGGHGSFRGRSALTPTIDHSVRIPLAVAVAWSVALIPGALFLPLEDPERLAYQVDGNTVNRMVSLVQANGARILWIPVATLALTLVAACVMALRTRHDSRVPSRVAAVIGVVILLGAVVVTVTFLVGIILAPAGVLVLVASEHSRTAQSLRGSAEQCPCGRKCDASSRYCPWCGEPLRGSRLT